MWLLPFLSCAEPDLVDSRFADEELLDVEASAKSATVASYTGSAAKGSYSYPQVSSSKTYTFYKYADYTYGVNLTSTSGDCDLYLDYRGYPSKTSYQYKVANHGTDESKEFPVTSNGKYYVSVYGYGSGTCKYSLYVYRY